MGEVRTPSYTAYIPSKVRYDRELKPNAKLLYAEINALADYKGYCWATNEYLAKLLDISKRTVQELVSALAEKGFVEVEVVRDERTNEVVERRIWVDVSMRNNPPPSCENLHDPSCENLHDPSCENLHVEQDINLLNEIPPIVPQDGGPAPKPKRKRKEPKTAPDHEPERFAAFWKAYPRGENKQGAIRAWDNLKPSPELLDQMSIGLARALQSDDWKRGYGIPHASTWLNNRRWEDQPKTPPKNVPESGTGRQWADR